MADEEQGKRRRGKRGGRNRSSGQRAEPAAGNQPPSVPGQQPPEPGAPLGGVTPSTGQTGRESARQSAAHASGAGRRERRAPTAGGRPDQSPMDFWRSGQPRTHRERGSFGKAGPTGGGGGIIHNIRNMYFPPWVPVVGIIVVVFGILGGLFFFRSASGSPRIGEDHWHANYTFDVCGERQPNAPTWEGVGVHTHGDGIVHIHPFTGAEEGAGARLVKWFDYGGGELSDDAIRLPGLSETWENGEVCPEGFEKAGEEGVVQVFVNSRKLDDWSRYIPKDGDRIRLVFGPSEVFTQLTDRIVLPEEEDLREINITVTGNESSTAFDPSGLQLDAGETVRINFQNDADVSHGLRFAGDDGIYDTGDDFVAVPVGSDPESADQGDIIEPGGAGFVIVRFDQAGEIQFKDPTATNPDTEEPFATGTVIVGQAGTPTPGPEEVDIEVNLVARDGSFEPAELNVPAGDKFRLNVTVEGDLGHSIRIAGEDGEFETPDDILSDLIPGGETGSLEGTIEEPGEYEFRCDFHPDETGTITVE